MCKHARNSSSWLSSFVASRSPVFIYARGLWGSGTSTVMNKLTGNPLPRPANLCREATLHLAKQFKLVACVQRFSQVDVTSLRAALEAVRRHWHFVVDTLRFRAQACDSLGRMLASFLLWHCKLRPCFQNKRSPNKSQS